MTTKLLWSYLWGAKADFITGTVAHNDGLDGDFTVVPVICPGNLLPRIAVTESVTPERQQRWDAVGPTPIADQVTPSLTGGKLL